MQNLNIWKPVPVTPFQDAYEINPAGQVRTVKTGKILKPGRPDSSSPFVILASKQADGGRHPFTVSKLVSLAFPKAEELPEPARVIDWNSTKSMFTELNFLRVQNGRAELKKWSQSTQKLVDALRREIESVK